MVPVPLIQKRVSGAALEPRFQVAVLDVPGLSPLPTQPAVDPFNFVSRVQLPVLMLSGEYDQTYPLETAALMVMAGHQLPDDAYDMVSNNVRRAIGLPEVHFRPGDPADLVAIDAASIRGAIADAPMSRRVFRGGKLVASADQQTSVHR